MKQHPEEVLFQGEKPFPTLSACEHFVGSQRLAAKALEMQNKSAGRFDITLDLEDGAGLGSEKNLLADFIAIINSTENRYDRLGFRVHPCSSPAWESEISSIIKGAGKRLAYITIPKASGAAEVRRVISFVKSTSKKYNIKKNIPLHVLVETHGALAEVQEIAKLPQVEVLDFGIMDFIAAHNGAIDSSNISSPGQFEHALLVNAKTRIASAAISHAKVAAHNVTLAIKDYQQTKLDAERAYKEFGFLRMWSVYPTQIDAILEAFTPQLDKVEQAEQVLRKAQNHNWGPIQYEDKLYDRASYRCLWQLLKRAQLSGINLSEQAQQTWFNY